MGAVPNIFPFPRIDAPYNIDTPYNHFLSIELKVYQNLLNKPA